MKFSQVVAFVLGSVLATQALLIPENVRALSLPESSPIEQRDLLYNELERRKGGGGGGKGGSGTSSGSSSGSSTHALGITQKVVLTCNQAPARKVVIQDHPPATAVAPPALRQGQVYLGRMAPVEDTTVVELQFHTKPD